MPKPTDSRDLTAEQLAKLMTWAKEHWYADCACLEAPCGLVDTANGVALLIEQHARSVVELNALRERITKLADYWSEDGVDLAEASTIRALLETD